MIDEALVPALEFRAPLTEPPFLPGDAEGAVEVWEGTGGYEVYGYDVGGYAWIQFPGLGAFRFLDTGSVVAIPEPGVAEARIEDQYLRGALPLVMQMRGHQVLHGSAVSSPSGVLAVCGASGAGKSTLAHALSRRGHALWADDAVVFQHEHEHEHAIAVAVPFTARVSAEARLALDAPNQPVDPSRFVSPRPTAKLHAILVLRDGDSETPGSVDIKRLTPAEAFTAVLPHAYAYRAGDPERTRALTTAYLELAGTVPIYDVRLRRSLDDLPAAVDRLEAEVLRA